MLFGEVYFVMIVCLIGDVYKDCLFDDVYNDCLFYDVYNDCLIHVYFNHLTEKNGAFLL